MRAETATNRGRMDMSVMFDGKCYIFEFKVEEKNIVNFEWEKSR